MNSTEPDWFASPFGASMSGLQLNRPVDEIQGSSFALESIQEALKAINITQKVSPHQKKEVGEVKMILKAALKTRGSSDMSTSQYLDFMVGKERMKNYMEILKARKLELKDITSQIDEVFLDNMSSPIKASGSLGKVITVSDNPGQLKEKITIRVKYSAELRGVLKVKMGKTLKLRKMMCVVARILGSDVGKLVFSMASNGRLVEGEETPAQLGMVQMDCIEVHKVPFMFTSSSTSEKPKNP